MTSTASAREYLWTIEQGELETLRIPVLDGTTPFDITGWSVDAKFKTSPGATVLYTFPPEAWAVTGGTNVDLTIVPSTSLAWDFRRGWYRVKVVHPSDVTQVHRILQGRFMLSED